MAVRFLLLAVVSGVAVYTFAYGVRAWRMKNIVGAVGLTLLALATVGLPAFMLFFRK